MPAIRDKDKLSNEKHRRGSTKIKTSELLKNIQQNLHSEIFTEPQEDFCVGFGSILAPLASASNSSARPHEQSLQAFRFPVVEQTLSDSEVGFCLSSSSSKSSASIISSSSTSNFQTLLAAGIGFLPNDSLVFDPIS